MDWLILLVIVVISYLLGSISFARLVSRLIDPKADLNDVSLPVQNSDERMPMLAMGANTASIKHGPRVGCTVGLLDILKVFIPTLAVRLLYPDTPYALFAATAGFVGHCWPVFYGFKGGRGVSAFYGALFAIDPLGAVIVALTGLIVGMAVLQELLVAYTGGVVLTIGWFTLTYFLGWTPLDPLIWAVVINILMGLALIPEIRMIREMRAKHGKGDMMKAMENFPMGRSMLKLMDMLRFKRP
jgi:glycerol-3-phosphate acyltransferase PlsY